MHSSSYSGRKVLLVGNVFGRDFGNSFYMILPKLLHGLIRNGCNLHAFNDREIARASTPFLTSITGWHAANRKLITTCRNFRPDLLLLGHCEVIRNATLAAIRDEMPDIRIAYRNVDALSDGPNRKRVSRRAEIVDKIFVTTAAPILETLRGSRAEIYFIPNPVDSAIDTGRAFMRNDQNHDVFFAVNTKDRRVDFVAEAISRVPGLSADIRCIPGKPPAFGAAYIAALANARMGISLSRPDNAYLYASDRMSQLLGNGLLTFVSRSTGFGDIFTDNQIAFFDGPDELAEKLAFFARNDRERRKVAEAGWAAAHSMFASERVARYILEQSFDDPLSENYPWLQAISNPAGPSQPQRRSMAQ